MWHHYCFRCCPWLWCRSFHRISNVPLGRYNRAWLAVTCGVALFLAYWMVFGLLEAKSDGVVMAVLGWAVWPFYIPGILAMILWGAVALSQMFGEVSHA